MPCHMALRFSSSGFSLTASLASLALPVTIDYPSGNCTLVAGQPVSIRWHFTNPSWRPTGSGLRITVTMAQGSKTTVFMAVVDNNAPLVQWPMPVSELPGLYIVSKFCISHVPACGVFS